MLRARSAPRSSLVWKTSNLGESPASPHRLFQLNYPHRDIFCPYIQFKSSPISIHDCCSSFSSHVSHQSHWLWPFGNWEAVFGLWSHLFSRLDEPSSLSLFSRGKCSSLSHPMGLHHRLPRLATSFLYWDDKTGPSITLGLTCAKYRPRITSIYWRRSSWCCSIRCQPPLPAGPITNSHPAWCPRGPPDSSEQLLPRSHAGHYAIPGAELAKIKLDNVYCPPQIQ